MNNTYRLVWNELSNTWVAVAENVKGRGKRSAGALLLTALTGVALAQSVSTQQLPTGGQIVSGSGSITAQGANMTVNQNSARMIANWGSFNIGANAGVKFVQPSANAVALNRIQSQDPTQILGRLTSNGQVMLVNPAGVMFGQGSQVDVGGLVASTLNISDTNFLNGNYRFANNSGTTAGIVSNQGRISTSSGGKLAFLAPVVKNHGLIETPKGSTLLAAAKDITVDFAGDGLISYRVNSEAVNALIENTVIVSVDGGIAVL
jgi:filamentous hemagglutinin family protein